MAIGRLGYAGKLTRLPLWKGKINCLFKEALFLFINGQSFFLLFFRRIAGAGTLTASRRNKEVNRFAKLHRG